MLVIYFHLNVPLHLKMAALELQDKDSHIGQEAVTKAIDSLVGDDLKVTYTILLLRTGLHWV